MEIRNVSHGIVVVNHDMSAAPLLGQLSFRITRGAEELSLQGHMNADFPTAKSYVALLPGQYFGGVFDLDLMEKLYGMTVGCYSVQVRYSDGKALKVWRLHGGRDVQAVAGLRTLVLAQSNLD